MNLAGKTISRTDGDWLFFTDGTSVSCSEYGLDFVDYAGTQNYLRRQQGAREQERMRCLHDTLHPRDKQYLAEQERLARQRRYEATSAMGKMMMDMERSLVEDMNRSAFGMWTLPLPLRLKRKRRPSKAYEIGKTYRRKNGSLFRVGGTLNIPYVKAPK